MNEYQASHSFHIASSPRVRTDYVDNPTPKPVRLSSDVANAICCAANGTVAVSILHVSDFGLPDESLSADRRGDRLEGTNILIQRVT